MHPLDPSFVIPIRAVPPLPAADRLAFGWAEGVVSLCVNLAVLAGLVHLAFLPARPTAEPGAISVELVPEVPKPKSPSRSAAVEPKPDVAAQPPPAATSPQAAQAKPETPEKPPPPTSPAKPPDPAPASLEQAPPAEVPPPIDKGSDPTPHLVEAPQAPAASATQSDRNHAANAEDKPARVEKPTEAPPAAVPDVLASTNANQDPVPPPASTAAAAALEKAASPEEIRQAENTAKLAAALPFSQSFAPEVKRAPVSGAGAVDAKSYRGAVYDAFRKADGIVAAARERKLKGQAVVVFSIDDKGELTRSSIAVTSGSPEVDQVALEIVRRSAPYPPPPPGGQRTFSPAIALGLDGQ